MEKLTTIGAICLLVLVLYLYLERKKLRKSLAIAEGKIQPGDESSNRDKILPQLPYEERRLRYKMNNTLEKQFILSLCKDMHGTEFTLQGSESEEEKRSRNRDASYASTHQLFKVFANTVTKMYQESPRLMHFVKGACKNGLYVIVPLAKGKCVFANKEHQHYSEFDWHFRMYIQLERNTASGQLPYVDFQLESYSQITHDPGLPGIGSVTITIDELTPEAAGVVIKALAAMAQPDTAIPLIMASPDLANARACIKERNPGIMEKLVNVPDWELIRELDQPQIIGS